MDLGGLRQADYRYNALGQQVSRDVGGAVTLSVHDLAGNRIAEHDDTGAVLREYIWLDGRPLAVVEGGQTYWLHWDQIGRPAMATDSTGSVVWAASYLPFGGIDLVWVDTRMPGRHICDFCPWRGIARRVLLRNSACESCWSLGARSAKIPPRESAFWACA